MIHPTYQVVLRHIFCCFLVTAVGACSLTKVGRQTATVDNLSTLEGTVQVEASQAAQVHVLLFRHNGMSLQQVDQQPLYRDGSYLFYVPPGAYLVGAFVDINGDVDYVGDEPATYYGEAAGEPTLLQVGENEAHTVPELAIERVLDRQSASPAVAQSSLASANVGRLADLSDDRFSVQYSSVGLWRPLDFTEEIGAGLFFLEDYDKNKIPVVFIHGINGSPRNFTDVIAVLDSEQFQPWVLHYPSGVPLQMVSDYLLRSLEQLRTQYDFERVYIVAHSMGGLMTRSFVLRHQDTQSVIELGLVVTINSPLYGMDSAASGVRTSPVVLPVWRDVASNSDYVKRVHASPWPSNVPYHLVFSYKDDKDGDGVVPMRSQLSRQLQREASAIHGFNAEHSGILKDPKFLGELNQILASP